MKLEKFHLLTEIMASGNYYIDWEAGEVIKTKGKKKIGYIENTHKKVSFRFQDKNYKYTAGEVIMAQLGHITEKNCEAVLVENLSGKPQNTKISNLRVLSKSDYLRVRHMKGNINTSGLVQFQVKALDPEKRKDILVMKAMGFYHDAIADVLGINKHTAKWYYYGYDKKHGKESKNDKRMVRKTQRRKAD